MMADSSSCTSWGTASVNIPGRNLATRASGGPPAIWRQAASRSFQTVSGSERLTHPNHFTWHQLGMLKVMECVPRNDHGKTRIVKWHPIHVTRLPPDVLDSRRTLKLLGLFQHGWRDINSGNVRLVRMHRSARRDHMQR